MKKNEPINQLVTTSPITVHVNDPVSKVRKIFDEHKVHHVPVISGKKLVGIVSWSDLLRVSFGEFGNQDGKQLDTILDHTYKLTDIMVANPKSISGSATVRDAARILAEANFHALPVVDGENLVGIVTSTDLLKFLADL
jgi:CBS domain-containing protein